VYRSSLSFSFGISVDCLTNEFTQPHFHIFEYSFGHMRGISGPISPDQKKYEMSGKLTLDLRRLSADEPDIVSYSVNQVQATECCPAAICASCDQSTLKYSDVMIWIS
jgi:hypothetical protein